MKKIKINFIFNLAYKNPFFYELLYQLEKKGYEVIVYDLISAKKYLVGQKKIISFNPFFGAKFILKIKYFRRLFIPLINKLTIENEFNKTDIVNIHYVHLAFVQYAKLLKKNSAKLITTFWGSDILRADEKSIRQYIPLLEKSDSISMVPGIQDQFKKIYPQFSDKVKTSYFGLSILDKINSIDISSIEKFKDKFDIKRGYIYVTVGYNAIHSQQHSILIEKLNKINKELKSKIFLLVPLTYGGNETYKHEVIKSLDDSGINYKVFPEFLKEEDLANLRNLSNVTLNIQKTDAFSGSISESIMANNIVLVGDWLPYDIYDEWDIKIYRENLKEFDNKMIDIFKNFDLYLEHIKGNSEELYKKLSWRNTLPVWEDLLLN